MAKYNTKQLLTYLGYKHKVDSDFIYKVLATVHFNNVVLPNKFTIRDHKGIYDSILDCFNNWRILYKLVYIYFMIKEYPTQSKNRIIIDSKVIHQNKSIEIIIGYIR